MIEVRGGHRGPPLQMCLSVVIVGVALCGPLLFIYLGTGEILLSRST